MEKHEKQVNAAVTGTMYGTDGLARQDVTDKIVAAYIGPYSRTLKKIRRRRWRIEHYLSRGSDALDVDHKAK